MLPSLLLSLLARIVNGQSRAAHMWDSLAARWDNWTLGTEESLTVRLKYSGEFALRPLPKGAADELVEFLATSLYWPMLSSLTGDVGFIEKYLAQQAESLCEMLGGDYFDAERYNCRSYPLGLGRIVRERPRIRGLLDDYLGRRSAMEAAEEFETASLAIEHPELFSAAAGRKALAPLPQLPAGASERAALQFVEELL